MSAYQLVGYNFNTPVVAPVKKQARSIVFSPEETDIKQDIADIKETISYLKVLIGSMTDEELNNLK